MECKGEGPLWAHLALMALLNALIAVFLALGVAAYDHIPVLWVLRQVLPFSECIGFSVLGLHGIGQMLLGSPRLALFGSIARLAYWTLVAVMGAYLGFALALFLGAGGPGAALNPWRDSAVVPSAGLGLAICFIVYRVVTAQSVANQARADAEQARVRFLAAESMAATANLKLLQAQIEPHFLFNTLANVVGLIEPRPEDARRMLEDFIDYLRGSLNGTRQASTTLGSEMKPLRSYLSILRFRMGEHLQFDIDMPVALDKTSIIPMLLQPIVENAIAHGLEPTVDGGRISVRALIEGDLVHIEVADTGQGFRGDTSAGVGLANVRERLRLGYGVNGQLKVRAREPRGTIVTISYSLHGGDNECAP